MDAVPTILTMLAIWSNYPPCGIMNLHQMGNHRRGRYLYHPRFPLDDPHMGKEKFMPKIKTYSMKKAKKARFKRKIARAKKSGKLLYGGFIKITDEMING